MTPSASRTAYSIELKDGAGGLIYAESDHSDTAITRLLTQLVLTACDALLGGIMLANKATRRAYRTYDRWRSQWCQKYRSVKTPHGFREGRINIKTIIFAVHNRRE